MARNLNIRVMERVEHNVSSRKWNQRSLCASGCVTIDELASGTASTTRVEVGED